VMMQEYGWGREQRSLFDRYSTIVVASRFMRDEYLRAGVAADAVRAIPLFAPPHAVATASDEGPWPIDVLFLGRMTKLKGPDVLVEAAAHASARLGRRLSVVFAGDGPERERLRAMAETRGIDARFPGWVMPQDRDVLLRQAAMIAVPSRWSEPFALVGLEAGVFGTPAVAFDAGGIGDWLTDGENGRLVNPARGAAGLGDAIADILEQPAVRRQFAAGAREVAAQFSVEKHVRLLMPLLDQAAVTHAARR
jgi:glycosyltransferase involved in cell wall biosynthesis